MTEFLCGVRVIKFYTWEQHFGTRVHGCRAKELKSLQAIKYLDAVCVYLWAALPVVVSILIFITYVLLGHQLSATKVGEMAFQEHFYLDYTLRYFRKHFKNGFPCDIF